MFHPVPPTPITKTSQVLKVVSAARTLEMAFSPSALEHFPQDAVM